ncbi:hypothetical protein B0H13DRAFT_2669048 [Mycena leptocephala]|nr:hypothetical protein B0H13DRAFT_2669048 [Mycena leptocephala]
MISCLTLSRNRYASGYLALPLAVWLFATKAHVDEKRILSRFGFSVHDSTARACLDSLTDSSLAKMREDIQEGIAAAATAILLEDCPPGAFDLQDYLDRVMSKERQYLTAESLWADIDLQYLHDLIALHWVRILVTFIPELAHLRKEVTNILKSEAMTKLRLRQRKSIMQPVGTNAEHSTETQEDIVKHFENSRVVIPDVESLWDSARILVRRYASQDAYDQALDKNRANSATEDMKVPRGTSWTAPVDVSRARRIDDEDGDADLEEEQVLIDDMGEAAGLEEFFSDAESVSGNNTNKKKKKKKTKHVEEPDFSGDRALANEILFLQDMGWWMIAAHAVPEGEIGRVWEIMKLWIFHFSDSSNHNYTNYLLEAYCLPGLSENPILGIWRTRSLPSACRGRGAFEVRALPLSQNGALFTLVMFALLCFPPPPPPFPLPSLLPVLSARASLAKSLVSGQPKIPAAAFLLLVPCSGPTQRPRRHPITRLLSIAPRPALRCAPLAAALHAPLHPARSPPALLRRQLLWRFVVFTDYVH